MIGAAFIARGAYRFAWRYKGVIAIAIAVLGVWWWIGGLYATRAEQAAQLALKDIAIERLSERAVALHAQARFEREAREIADANNARLATRMQSLEARGRASRSATRRLRDNDPAVREWSRAVRPRTMSERLRDAHAAAFARAEQSAAERGDDAGVSDPAAARR